MNLNRYSVNRRSLLSRGISRLFRYLLCIVSISYCNAVFASRLEVNVVGVTDGDTLVVLDKDKVQNKVRIAGIDAPEKKQAFGHRAQQALASVVYRRDVLLDVYKKDRYGRLIAKIWLAGRDVGLDLVEEGFAWHYKAYAYEQERLDRERYAVAELAARKRRAGLWAEPTPMPPWEFRHQLIK